MTYKEAQITLVLLGWKQDGYLYWCKGAHATLTLYPEDISSKMSKWGIFNLYPNTHISSKHWFTYQEGINYLNNHDI